jgi:hypothetical protein
VEAAALVCQALALLARAQRAEVLRRARDEVRVQREDDAACGRAADRDVEVGQWARGVRWGGGHGGSEGGGQVCAHIGRDDERKR